MVEEWVVVASYASEAEARVVESFLRAQGFTVQLLDTYSPYRVLPVRNLGESAGMRLMAHAEDLEAIQVSLRESQKPTHLEVIGEEQPVEGGRYEYWVIGALLALGILVYFLR